MLAQRAVELDPTDPPIQTIRAAWQLMIERDFDGGVARHKEAFDRTRCGYAVATGLGMPCAATGSAHSRCLTVRGG